MSPEEVFALLKKRIDALSGPEIKQAVSEYLEKHPDAALEVLGLYKDEQGYICQKGV